VAAEVVVPGRGAAGLADPSPQFGGTTTLGLVWPIAERLAIENGSPSQDFRHP
jgi:hypothetical protein